MNDTRIGFVGATGLMGHGMAKNLLLKGFPLKYTMRNRVPEGLDELGATRAESFEELGATSDVVVICVTTAADVEEIVTGLLTNPAEGLIILDASTSEPGVTKRLGALCAAKGVRLADIPLAKSAAEAEAGTLNVMVGADDELFAEIEPVLKAFATGIYRVGGLGAGHTIKLVNNTVFQSALTMLAEGMAVCVKAGVDPAQLIEVMSGGGFATGGPLKIMGATLKGDYSGLTFQLDNARKDVRYYNRLAGELGVPAVVGEGVHEALVIASALGFGGEYNPTLTKAAAKLNGIEITSEN